MKSQAPRHSQPAGNHFLRGLIPLLWYILITIIVPLAKDPACLRDRLFMEHARMVIGLSVAVTILFLLVARLGRFIKRWLKKRNTISKT